MLPLNRYPKKPYGMLFFSPIHAGPANSNSTNRVFRNQKGIETGLFLFLMSVQDHPPRPDDGVEWTVSMLPKRC